MLLLPASHHSNTKANMCWAAERINLFMSTFCKSIFHFLPLLLLGELHITSLKYQAEYKCTGCAVISSFVVCVSFSFIIEIAEGNFVAARGAGVGGVMRQHTERQCLPSFRREDMFQFMSTLNSVPPNKTELTYIQINLTFELLILPCRLPESECLWERSRKASFCIRAHWCNVSGFRMNQN